MSQHPTRARDLGVAPGIFRPGPLNTITDVAGVRVGQTTLIQGDSVRTGVTAILPHAGDLFHDRVPAAIYVGNGFGKLLGSTQVTELGEVETPILLACTLCTSSRILSETRGGWTVGVLVQTNFGDVLQVMGAPVGRELGRYAFQHDVAAERGDGSCMIVRRHVGLTANTSSPAQQRFLSTTELSNDDMSPLFQGVVEATEEAIYNSLFMATTVTSRERTVEAIPLDRVRAVLQKYTVEKR